MCRCPCKELNLPTCFSQLSLMDPQGLHITGRKPLILTQKRWMVKRLLSPCTQQHERCAHAPFKTGMLRPPLPLISINSHQSNEQINHHLLVIYLFCQTENTPLPQRLVAHYTNPLFHAQRFRAYITDLWFQLSSITFHFPVNILHKTFLEVSWDFVLLLI